MSKFPPSSLDPSVATVRAPAVTAGGSENRIDIFTYQTKVSTGGTDVLYPGDRMWAKLTLTLRGAGPVAVGQNANLTPVLSGKGRILQTGVPAIFNVPKGSKLYIASTAISLVDVVVEAFPWLETITGLVGVAAGMPGAGFAAPSTGKTR